MFDWLHEDWKKAWKWLQVQLVALIALAPEVYNQADALQSIVPPAVFRHVMAALGVLVIVNSVRKKRGHP